MLGASFPHASQAMPHPVSLPRGAAARTRWKAFFSCLVPSVPSIEKAQQGAQYKLEMLRQSCLLPRNNHRRNNLELRGNTLITGRRHDLTIHDIITMIITVI